MSVFVIEDELHDEWCGDYFASYEEAIEELKRLAALPWDEEPNQAPCTSWKTCGRLYEIIEYSDIGRKELSRVPVLEISSEGVVWNKEALKEMSL